MITKYFLRLISNKRYKEAVMMLNRTPFINLSDKDTVGKKISDTQNSELINAVFDYTLSRQKRILEDYNKRREAYLQKLSNMEYVYACQNDVARKTIDGFNILMNKEEFKPNSVIGEGTLFEQACKLDKNGGLAKEILSKYDDVLITMAARTKSEKIREVIDEYESGGRYKLRMDNIKRKLINPATREIAIIQLKDFINSSEFKPEMTDTMGNSALHIVSTIADNSSRGLIEKLIRKGVDINAKNITEQIPIMSAIRALMATTDKDAKELLLSNIKFLIDKGANIEEQDKNGQTVFHYVCATTSVALLAMILKKKPNVFIEDLKGNRPHTYLKSPEMKKMYFEYVTK